MRGLPVQARPWDLYVILAARFGWTPDEINRMDPDFVDELMAYLHAERELNRDEIGHR